VDKVIAVKIGNMEVQGMLVKGVHTKRTYARAMPSTACVIVRQAFLVHSVAGLL
jgi:hypothetical protein